MFKLWCERSIRVCVRQKPRLHVITSDRGALGIVSTIVHHPCGLDGWLNVLYGGLSCFQYSRFFALIYKGKRVFRHETNLNDTESALLPEGMKKSVCVFMLVENGVAL